MYSFSYGTFTRASTIYLDSVTNSTFHADAWDLVQSSPDYCHIQKYCAHTPWKKRKQIKEKSEPEREARLNKPEIQKSKAVCMKNLKIVAKQAIILILSSSLA